MRKATYIKNKEWNKSRTLLFPLLYTAKTQKQIIKPIATYSLFIVSSTEEYSIADGYLTCVYNTKDKNNIIGEEVPIVFVKKINSEKVAIVYDLKKEIDTCNKFINGKYSTFSENTKSKIYKFYNSSSTHKPWEPDETEGVKIDLILYPSKYYDLIAKELNIDPILLKENVELTSPPDFLNKETLQL